MKVLELSAWTEHFSPEEMDSQKVQEYLDFIVQAVKRYDSERYSEWHHVMPKCIDQGKYRDEGVRINGADHFRAHLKLVECFSGRKKSLLAYALMRMRHNVVSHGEVITPEEWESAVQTYARANSERSSKRVGPLNPNYGKRYKLNLTDEQRSRRREILIGNKYGSRVSEEVRKRMSKRFSGEGNPFYGKTHSKEARQRISESRQGELNPCYGKVWITNGEVCKRVSTREVDSYISQGYWKGRVVSDKTRKAMSESQSGRLRDEKGRWV